MSVTAYRRRRLEQETEQPIEEKVIEETKVDEIDLIGIIENNETEQPIEEKKENQKNKKNENSSLDLGN